MHIKRCTASIDQAHISRYNELQQIKAAKKGLLNDYSRKIISSISPLQDNSSEIVESNIQRNSRGMFLSNTTAIYDSSFISKIFSQSPESNQTSSQKGSFFSWETTTHRRWWLLTRLALQLQSLISLFLKDYHSIYLRNLGSIRCWS